MKSFRFVVDARLAQRGCRTSRLHGVAASLSALTQQPEREREVRVAVVASHRCKQCKERRKARRYRYLLQRRYVRSYLNSGST